MLHKFILFYPLCFIMTNFQTFLMFCTISAYANRSFNYEWNLIVILSILNAISNYFTLCTKEIFSFLYDIKTFSTEAKRWRAAKRLPCFEQPIWNDRFCNLSSKIIEFSHDSSKLTIVKWPYFDLYYSATLFTYRLPWLIIPFSLPEKTFCGV